MEHIGVRRVEGLGDPVLEPSRTVVPLQPKAKGIPEAPPRTMRVALVGNFAPRKCGIATFTTDLCEKLGHYDPEIALDVYALQDKADPVVHERAYSEIDRASLRSYARAARQMNADGVDAVWLQHEFGIFGGHCGSHVLHFVDRIAAPLIVTMHTVLSRPSAKQEAIVSRLIARASRIMVMCRAGREVLIERYRADPDRVVVIEHGAPDRPMTALRRSGPRTLMTFGLLGPGKGLETAIEALPTIIARHPDTIYRIAGVSHPNELRRHGEAYRESLVALAERLGVARHIEWVNRFLDMDDLIALLADCDIYLTPYPNLQQSTSGTLSYAVALGRAVVSTPYIHARELLGDVGGLLVEPGQPDAISRAVNHLLDRPDELEALQLRTYRRGRRTVWRYFAENARALLDGAVRPDAAPEAANDLSVPGLSAFEALCDGTGILQHGKGIVPDRGHGYCLDDNARALMLVHRVAWRNPGEELQRATTFASFIQHAWNDDRKVFRNFMNFDRSWCEDEGSEDSNARALWALGDMVSMSRLAPLRRWAHDGFARFAPIACDFGAPRSIAFAALGATAVLRAHPDDRLARAIAERSGSLLFALLDAARRPDWAWFEAIVGYDNPRLPQALAECGEAMDRPDWVAAALAALHWILDRQRSVEGWFRPVGSDSFGLTEEILPFDQQPLEAWAAIDACASAARIDPGDPAWIDHAGRAWRWFLGENDRRVALADLPLGACMDGINPHGANLNCGAESLLAFQLAYYGYEELIRQNTPVWREDGAEGSRS